MAVSGGEVVQQCPTNTVAGMFELYEQVLATRLYTCHKTQADATGDVMCRLYHNAPEGVAHVPAGCTALAQKKYMTRHNAGLMLLFFKILQDLGLVDSVPPWFIIIRAERFKQD